MIYCINPLCQKRDNSETDNICTSCRTSLVIHDRFRLIRLLRPLDLEKGTEIFEVIDEKSERPKVHKVMKILSSDKPDKIKAIEREADILSRLRHPGIPFVSPEDYFVVKLDKYNLNLNCLVMQKFEGEDLESWVRFHAPITQEKALKWLQQLFEILDFIHKANILHRDIKPSNIILQSNKRLALIDFGAVKNNNNNYQEKTDYFQNLTRVISSGYTSPEQLQGIVSLQSDFYSLGATFVYLLTREQPSKLINEKTLELEWRSKTKDIEEPLLNFIDGLIAYTPDKRPKDAKHALECLKRLPFRRSRLFRSKKNRAGVAIALSLLILGIYEISLPKYLSRRGDYLFKQGVKAQTVNQTQEAESAFTEAIKINPHYTDSVSVFYFQSATKAQEDNRAKDALVDFHEAIKFNPKLALSVADFYFREGVKSQNGNQLDDAQKDFQLAAKINPNLVSPISKFYFKQASGEAQPKEARKLYEQAIYYNPNDADAYNNLALVCQHLDDLNCIKNSYNKVFTLEHNSWEAHFGLGNYYDNKRNYAAAREEYNSAKIERDIVPQALNNLARLDNLEGNYTNAIKLALQGLERTKNSRTLASLYKNLGWSNLEQKQYTKAREYLQTALLLNPSRIDTHCLLAKSEQALNDLSNATTNWDICLRMNSFNQPEVESWKEQALKQFVFATFSLKKNFNKK